jgi:hypothetical protein
MKCPTHLLLFLLSLLLDPSISYRWQYFERFFFKSPCLSDLSQMVESLKGGTDEEQTEEAAKNEEPSDNTATDEKPAELAPNHSLHYASTEPANAAPKPKPVLKSKKPPLAKGAIPATKPAMTSSMEVR